MSCPFTLRGLALLTALLALVANQASAASFSQDFNGQNANGFTFQNPIGTGSFSFPLLSAGNYGYNISSTGSPSPLAIGPGRAGSFVGSLSQTNFSDSVDIVGFQPGIDQAFGISARGGNFGAGTTNGYYLNYNSLPDPNNDGHLGQTALQINRVASEAPTNIGGTYITPPSNASDVLELVFTGQGANLTGQLFDKTTSTLLGTVNVTDSTYASGNPGLFAFDNSGLAVTGANATFDNFLAVNTPEPSSFVLAFVGMVLWAAGGWRRRRQIAGGR